MGTLQKVSDFATDPKTLTIFGIGVTLYLLLKVNEYMSLREFSEGRYSPSGLVKDEGDV